MSHELIKDFGLTAKQLEEKYEKKGAHPVRTTMDWAEEVRQGYTLLGYWDWVEHQIAEYQDELDSENPYVNHSGL